MVSLLKSAMTRTARATRRHRANVESLESRSLPSATTWPGLSHPVIEVEDNNTLDAAQNLGDVSRGHSAEFAGAIGEAHGTSSDVDWYRFSLADAGRVQILALPDASEATSPVVLTLYGDQLAQFDPALPLQHQLLGRQEQSSYGPARPVDLRLEAGTYFVAVSGAGNRHFHPFVADSGVPGTATNYGVRIAVASGQAPAGNHDQFAPVAERGRSGDDTPITANNLGDLTTIERLQVNGTIGDDRFYEVSSADPFAMNPAADVDLFRFSITGNGKFALIAEVFAGRIGSPLDPALTLFRANDVGALQLVATNNNSLNPIESTNGQFPFADDAALFSGLSTGTYFLAVSSSGNDVESGPDGVFDPQVAHSGLHGGSVGKYVLDLFVNADNIAPQVVGQVFNNSSRHTPCAEDSAHGVCGLLSGDVELTAEQVANLPQAPTHLSLQFSEAVNLQQLAYSAFQQVGQNSVRAVFIEGSDGTRDFPRLQSYDPATGTARFLMLDGLPNGDFALHVSGAMGLTDFAGNQIVGNDASGDFVTRFSVADASRVGDPMLRFNASGNDSFETAQDLGVLFPHELQSEVNLVRDAATNAAQPADSADYFRFELLQSQAYFFTLSNFGDGTPPTLEVLNAAGQAMPLASLPGSQGLLGFLPAGKYVLHFGSWDTSSASNVIYQVEIELAGVSENPTPLTSGAAPAVGIRLAGQGPANVYAPPIVTDFSQPQFAAIPSGLLQGLNAPALGGQVIAPSFSPNTALVRLFGFSSRDQLFSLIDANLPRAADAPEITQAELTDEELNDLLNRNREVSGETTADDASTETTADEEPPSEIPAATDTTEASSQGVGSLFQAAPSSGPRTIPKPMGGLKKTPDPVARATEQQPAAFSAPLAFALATSLAGTLRERARREKERTNPMTNFQIPMSNE